jgi:hypothetical protein
MKLPQINVSLVLGGAVAAGLLYMWARGPAKAAQDVGQAVGGAVVGAVDGVLSGVVIGGGQVIGVPKTSMTKCQKAMAEGRTWDASFDCPAGTWLKYLWD